MILSFFSKLNKFPDFPDIIRPFPDDSEEDED